MRRLAAAALALVGATGAQIEQPRTMPKLGEVPDLDVVATWNGAPRHLDELYGRVVLLHVFWAWWEASTVEIPNVRKLADTYGERGLTVIGVSDEPERKLAQCIETHKVSFPVARIRQSPGRWGRFTMQLFVLLDVDGRVISSSSDGPPSARQIEGALDAAAFLPELGDDSRFAPLRTRFEARRFASAREYAERMIAEPKLDPELRDVLSTVRDRIDRLAAERMVKNPALALGGDHWYAILELERVAREWRGLPVAGDARLWLEQLRASPQVKREVAAAERLDAVLRRTEWTERQRRNALLDVEHDFPDTRAAFRARGRVDHMANGG